jgi:Skp family chaperone for outer membrane proteins
MKATTAVVLCSVVGLVVLSVGYSGHAQAPAVDPLSRIGVVSVMKILRDCQRQSAHEKEVAAEQDRLSAELSEMNQKLARENDQLKTFKPGTPEHLDLYKAMAEGQGRLRALQEYYQNASTLKDKQWTEQLFKEVVEATAKIAEQKGLALVLERTEPEYPIPAERFFLAVGSYKVLYAKGCTDLTAEVQAAIDKK